MMHRALPLIAILLAVAAVAAADSPSPGGVVNVNSASVEQLQLLPRVGPALAERIVAFREANGPFASVDELAAVKGIGERTLELMRPHVSTSGETTLSEKVKSPRKGRDS